MREREREMITVPLFFIARSLFFARAHIHTLMLLSGTNAQVSLQETQATSIRIYFSFCFLSLSHTHRSSADSFSPQKPDFNLPTAILALRPFMQEALFASVELEAETNHRAKRNVSQPMTRRARKHLEVPHKHPESS